MTQADKPARCSAENMIVFDDNGIGGQLRLVDAAGLADATSIGSTLLAIVSETKAIDVARVIDDANAPNWPRDEHVNGSLRHIPAGKKLMVESALATVQMYLVRDNPDSTWAEMQRQLKVARDVSIEKDSELCSLRASLATMHKRADNAESALELSRGAHDKQFAVFDEERRLRKRMESDIAKIRTALGDLRMKEILGGG